MIIFWNLLANIGLKYWPYYFAQWVAPPLILPIICPILCATLLPPPALLAEQARLSEQGRAGGLYYVSCDGPRPIDLWAFGLLAIGHLAFGQSVLRTYAQLAC